MIQKPINRRRFLGLAAGALGACTLSCAGLAVASSWPTDSPEIELAQSTFGEAKSMDRILVAYASATGSTAGVADAIGKSLAETGTTVEVCRMQEVQDLSPYRAVVAGSAIHGKMWLPEAMQFMRTHQVALRNKPFAAFLVCITLAAQNAKYRDAVAEWLAPVRALVQPVSEGLFAGRLEMSRIPNWSDRVLFRASVLMGIWKEGDYRDWNEIRLWAESLRPLLLRDKV